MNRELERFDPAEQAGRISYEHLHRYALCREYVAGMRVLDMGCGTGYGSAILSSAAASVTGVDISDVAIRSARQRYSAAANLEYLCANCFELPFNNDSFDAVVANEIIEHVEDHEAFIAEARRVLKPGGLFLVSTPNKPVYNRQKAPNIYHVSEMDIPEFRALLRRHFSHIQLTGTRMALVSASFVLEASEVPSNSVSATVYCGMAPGTVGQGIVKDDLRLGDPEYVLAVCAQREFEAPDSASSLFYSREDDLWLQHEQIMAWASGLHEEDEVLRADLASARDQLATGMTELEDIRRDNQTLQLRLDDLRGTSAGAAQAFDQQRRVLEQQAAQQLEIVSRLLGKIGGLEVPSDPVSVIEGLFELQTKVTLQEARLERLTEAEQRVGQLMSELDAACRSRHEAEQLASERDARAAGLQADLNTVRDQLARDTADHIRQIKTLEQTRAAETARAADTIRSLEEAVAEARAHKSRAQEVQSPTAAEDGQLLARRRQFAKTHRGIHSQLSDAARAVVGRIPEPPQRMRTWKHKLLALPAPLNTVLFDRDWIAKQEPGLGRLSLTSFIANPKFHGIDPHPLFSAHEYLTRYPDVAASGMSPLAHYVLHGWREGRDPHPYFANDWYLYKNPDVMADASINPLDHYLVHGWREGRWPNPVFDPQNYLDRNPDVAQAGLEPLTHYVSFGKAENRNPHGRLIDPDWRRFVPASHRGATPMDFLLHDPVAEVQADATSQARPTARNVQGSDAQWPPAPLGDYWPPQRLRDFIIGGYGEEALGLYWYALSVMEAFRDEPEEFAGSDACRLIVSRLRSLVKSRATHIGAEAAKATDASIIIPVYNNILDTLLCLLTVLESADERSFEVIVADDCSSDATKRLIADIASASGVVRYVRHAANLGFLGNCNAAAEQARGRHIVLLNNDTLVTPRWLDHLLAPFDDFENVGFAGAKLINWDGTLQEAGGIFWNDGSAWNFGRGQEDARAPEFSYVHDVDYCSGAAIAIPTPLWRKVGGFDPLFQPAYCEDSDLAFRLRAEGYRTVLAASCEVIHHEGRSHGRDLSSGIKAYQVTNQQRLLERWRDVLERENFPNARDVHRARDRSRNKRHILVVDHYVPQWDRDAGSRTMRQFIDALIDDDWAVTFWPDNLFRDPDYTPALQARGVEVIHGGRFAGGFARFLEERDGLYDAVLLSRPHISERYIDDVRRLTSARIAYYGHDVHFQRMIAQREKGDDTIVQDAIDAQRRQELDICSRSDTILYPSREEAELMGRLVPANVLAMPIAAYSFGKSVLATARTALDIREAGQPDVATLLFVGGFAHTPNVDGVQWFCNKVMPLLREAGLRCRLQVAGSNAGADIWSLERDDVEVLGFVSDERLAELYREAAVVVAPLRFGAGVKGKVVEAMAHGVPVATTTTGAQGLENSDRYLFIGDTPEDLADAVKSALDPQAGRKHAEAALDYVENTYSGAAVRTALRKAFAVSQ